MTSVLITGGCGFIGSNLTEYLLTNTNWQIIVLDNLSTGQLKDISELTDFNNRVKFIQGDIVNVADVSRATKSCDYIINLAAQTSVIDSVNDPFKDEEVNIKGTLNLLKGAIENNVKVFIHASSAAAVGVQEMPMDENKIPKPISPYGASKLAGEAYCRVYSEIHALKGIVLRFSNVYGPKSYNKGSVIAKFMKQILKGESLEIYGDGNQTRDFIHVRDICSAIYLSIIKGEPNFDLFQLGTGVETSINSLVEMLKEITESYHLKHFDVKHGKQRPGEIIYNYTDITKANQKLGFTINCHLKKGLKETFEWFIKNENIQ